MLYEAPSRPRGDALRFDDRHDRARQEGAHAGPAGWVSRIPQHSSRDLTAVTGIDLPDAPAPHHPDSATAARLIWAARRLTAGQQHQVEDGAHAIRHEPADDLEADMRCSYPGPLQ
jgi:hypothetical protein